MFTFGAKESVSVSLGYFQLHHAPLRKFPAAHKALFAPLGKICTNAPNILSEEL